jgi:hypothetical protein
VPLRRLRCQSLIFLPIALRAWVLMAGEKLTIEPSPAAGQAGPEAVAEELEAGVLGEWREGTSPSRSLRTVRDGLPSYGSHSPALG